MTRRRLAVVISFLLIATGALTGGARILSDRHRQFEVSQRRAAQLEKQIASLRRERDETQRELASAEHQLAELPVPDRPASNPVDRGQKPDATAWLARVTRLKQLFDHQPGQRIPEMKLLTNEDWLLAAQRIPLETEEDVRKALATLRTAAKTRFSEQLLSAMKKYSATSDGPPSAGALALAAYLENPANVELLQRYEIANPELHKINFGTPQVVDGVPLKSAPADSHWALRESAPIDADYDVRPRVTNDRVEFLTPPTAWLPTLQDRVQRALTAYAKANQGAIAAGVSSLLPYFNPPLEPELEKRLLRDERR